MSWLVFALMGLAAAAIILLPLYGARHSRPEAERAPGEDEALGVYRQQLDELERDIAQGLLDSDEAAAGRLEIHRRMLAAGSAGAGAGAGGGIGATRAIAGVLALTVLAAATALYFTHGEPGLVSQPRAPAPSAEELIRLPPAMGKIADRLAQLEARLAEEPDDLEGWSMLARSYRVLQRPSDAANAYARAVLLDPRSVELRIAQGEALIDVLGGLISPAARLVFADAEALAPGHPAPRFYLGLAEYQNGDPRAALAIWRSLEAESPSDAPWLAALEARIGRAEADLGIGEEPAGRP